MRFRDFADALGQATLTTLWIIVGVACFVVLFGTFIVLLPQLGILGHFILGSVLLLFLALLAYEISLRW